MNNEIIKEKVKTLKSSYIFHSIIYIITSVIHILIYLKIYWLSKREKNVFFIEIIIIISFAFIPIILFFFTFLLILSKKYLSIIKQLLKILFYLFFLNSMIVSLSTWNNAQLLSTFYHECPFNFNVEEIQDIFDNFTITNKKYLKKKCKYRRCFPNDNYIKNNKIINNYICNLEQNNKGISCSILEVDYTKIKQEIINYIEYCQEFTKMYQCEKENNYISYKISYNFRCPNKSDVSLNYSLAFIFIFIDGIICSLPWLYEYYCLKDILSLLNITMSNGNNNHSLKETNNTSKINENISNNNSHIFEKQPTDIIIIENLKKYKSNVEDSLDILSINKIKRNNHELNSSKKLSNRAIKDHNCLDKNNKSKSENKLMNNNNNILNIMNVNIKSTIYKINKEK